mmetsp:Transcript_6062/g.16262  ORF Transcript_6062/g.16262 Transcript_6062/m.16262 type:complete len:202 (+) Transcript_6062:2286-2891(+)
MAELICARNARRIILSLLPTTSSSDVSSDWEITSKTYPERNLRSFPLPSNEQYAEIPAPARFIWLSPSDTQIVKQFRSKHFEQVNFPTLWPPCESLGSPGGAGNDAGCILSGVAEIMSVSIQSNIPEADNDFLRSTEVKALKNVRRSNSRVALFATAIPAFETKNLKIRAERNRYISCNFACSLACPDITVSRGSTSTSIA